MNKKFQKLLFINLAILLTYTLAIKTFSYLGDKNGFTSGMLVAVIFHAACNFLAAVIAVFTPRFSKDADSLLVCGGIVLLVGFSACLGGTSL
jgi:hypothetical protein